MLEVESVIDELYLAGGEAQLNPVRSAQGDETHEFVDYYLHEDPHHPVIRFDVLGSDRGPQIVSARGRLVYQVAVWGDSAEDAFPPLLGNHLDPPQHLETFHVNQNDDDWRSALSNKVKSLLAGLHGNVGTTWRTIDDVVSFCRKYFEGLAFPLVKKQLTSDVRLGWQMFVQNGMGKEQLAVRVIALAQMLQQWGHYQDAQRQLSEFFKMFPRDELYRHFDLVTADTALLVDLRIRQPTLGTAEAERHFSASVEPLRLDKHKGKFLWRENFHHLARGDYASVGENLSAYGDATGTDPVCDANAKLVKTAQTFAQGDRDGTLFYVGEYNQQLQSVLRHHRELPYGAVHGVFSGLSFEAHVLYRLGNREQRSDLRRFLQRLEVFQVQANIGAYSDGMAELGVMKSALPGDSPDDVILSGRGGEWKYLQGSREAMDITSLCYELHSLSQ